MHTGPFPMICDPDDGRPDDDIAAADCDSDGLTDRERFELRCWETRRDGDPVADRVSR